MDTNLARLNVLFCEVKPWEEDLIRKELSNVNVSFTSDKLTRETASKFSDIDIISIFVDSKANAETLEQFSNLKLISTRSTGYDHIDLAYCSKRNIIVTNVPFYGENTVAEHALTLMLCLLKRIPESIDRVKTGNFDPQGLTGSDMKGKVVGVVGTGHIGVNVIKYVKAMGAKVLAYDAFPNQTVADDIGFEYMSYEYLMSKADIVSYHTPLNKQTKHMFNKNILELIKPGVIIVNTARGGIIETDALFDGIKSGKIGGAGLDVLEEEAFLKEELELLHSDKHADIDFKVVLENQMLTKFPNVIITPHNAFNSHEALHRIVMTTIDNINCYISGNCKNKVL